MGFDVLTPCVNMGNIPRWLDVDMGSMSARMKIGFRRLFVLVSAGLCLCAWSCRPREEAGAAGHLKDGPLEPFQAELLDIAFEVASAMPVDPHIKNRSRTQQAVVAACLELDQPQRALRYIERIEDWRRGAGYADLAFHCVRDGATLTDVEPYLKLALEIAETTGDWRRDQIRVKAAQTYAYAGQGEAAARLQEGVEVSESGKVAQAQAMVCSAEAFDELMEALATRLASGQFDVVKNVLEAYAQLFNRLYADQSRRTQIAETIRTAWQGVPVLVRVELLTQLADSAIAHGNQAEALELAAEARGLMDSAAWEPRFEIPVRARLAVLCFRAGDRQGANAAARAALELFDTHREKIVSIDRAGMLRPIAEAYHAMADGTTALDLYRRALEAGIENPNSRPRAEDLAKTCCSMALHGAEPDDGLWKRIGEIRDGLGDPW